MGQDLSQLANVNIATIPIPTSGDDLSDRIKKAGYTLKDVGNTTLVVKSSESDDSYVTVAFYEKCASRFCGLCGSPTLVLNNNMNLLKKFLEDADIKKYEYNLQYEHGVIDCKLEPFTVTGNVLENDRVICIANQTTNRAIMPISHVYSDQYTHDIDIPHVLRISSSDIKKLDNYNIPNLSILDITLNKEGDIAKIIDNVKNMQFPKLRGVYIGGVFYSLDKCTIRVIDTRDLYISVAAEAHRAIGVIV